MGTGPLRRVGSAGAGGALTRGGAGDIRGKGRDRIACAAGNLRLLGAESQCEVVRADALVYAASLAPDQFDLALADPPYGTGGAAALAELFVEKHFARWLWVEHRVTEPLREIAGARTRRYGDTALTSIPAQR